MKNTIISQLEAARDSLTDQTWTQGVYFGNLTSNICFCAHGALQIQVNQSVKEAYEAGCQPVIIRHRMISVRAAKLASQAYYKLIDTSFDEDLQKVWDNRPRSSVLNEDAHYLLGMVGLTADFNDALSTTLDMVKTKFDEAIALAKRLKL